MGKETDRKKEGVEDQRELIEMRERAGDSGRKKAKKEREREK